MKKIIDKFKALRLKNCSENIADIIVQASEKNLSSLQTIERLLDLELEAREKARVNLRFKQSKLDEKVTGISLTLIIINQEKIIKHFF